eukprot:TRINITY_DN19268_c1_g1_i1.p1 TRINITY_DN19268_c1_g1~~TRINITY_DN19268_c1_g1_i1.p1  ORF type:complete len:420 (+),score=127.48 TRINITY_DN19268_c1_g1_i1:53-1261(+)
MWVGRCGRHLLKVRGRGRRWRSDWKDQEDGSEPDRSVKIRHFMACAVPMVGFGIMDNTIMIHAGDLIDNFFGQYLKFTLIAAAFGQLFSDVAGVVFGGTVEAIAARMGITYPPMSNKQRNLRSIKIIGTSGAAIGVMIGCCLGMLNLLFLDLEKADRMKRAEKMRTLFDAIIAEGWELVNCDRCTLYMLEDITKGPSSTTEPPTTLFTMVRHGVYPTDEELGDAFKYATGKDASTRPNIATEQLAMVLIKVGWEPKRVAQMLPDCQEMTYDEYSDFMTRHIVQEQCTVPLRVGGTKWNVVTSGKVLNIRDVYEDARFKDNRLSDQYSGYQSHSILIGPVKDDTGKVIGLVEFINKFKKSEEDDDGEKRTGLELTHFGEEDERLLHMMCTHCSTFIAHALGGD